MIKFAPASLAIFALLHAAPAMALDEAVARSVMTKAVDDYIRPAYKDFHAKAAALSAETARLCAAPSESQRDVVSARFADAIESWGRIEIIRDGPVLQDNRFERVLFYPDRKSTGLKQIQALLAKPDETATDPVALKDRSVAMQGLGAFEYVFFGTDHETGADEKDSFRCRYGLAVARNVEAIGGELEAAWDAPDGIQKDWKNPSADNAVYRNGAEAMQALIGTHVHGAEMVRDQRIKPFYRGPGEKLLPRAAVFWRSGNTMRVIAANIDGLNALWKISDMAALLPAGSKSYSDSILFDYKTAAGAARGLGQPTAEKLKDVAYTAQLQLIDFTLKDATTRINIDVGAVVGLDAGFSFADGD